MLYVHVYVICLWYMFMFMLYAISFDIWPLKDTAVMLQ